ncbi:hypothetical protein HOO54_11555 [Bacillus sp. WMMC1349]|uniref:UPF0715 family protein n=1 Tax=Bacillus sp. WMMC1349 TaxID=2736254 RepID=UPI0015518B12|nr:UPF0715 family protein [Bacillus sp. WMMC1349]NPC92850.1 hypothetical protein [Bacillus sp. WMMC1349]
MITVKNFIIKGYPLLTLIVAVLFLGLFFYLWINMEAYRSVALAYAQLVSIYALIVYSVAAFPLQFMLQLKKKSKKFDLSYLGLYVAGITVVSIVAVSIVGAGIMIPILGLPLFYGLSIFSGLIYWLTDSLFLLLKERLGDSC